MSDIISPTARFINAARTAIANAASKEPEIAQKTGSVVIDLAAFRPLSKIFDAHGHEVILTQQHVNMTVQYGPHSKADKKGILGILTSLPEYERLPAEWHHRC